MLRERITKAIAVIKRKPEQRKINRVLPNEEAKAKKVLDEMRNRLKE